jgi:hypothetical protein
MTAPVRRPASIAVLAGRFASQQLAFAHLLDVADVLGGQPDMDTIDVGQGDTSETRLRHYFDEGTVGEILSAAQGCDTIVLLTDPSAFPQSDTRHLRWLGVFPGHLVRSRPDAPC